MNLRPLKNNVVVRAGEEQEQTGLIVIPDTAKDRLPFFAIAVGPDCKDVKVGDELILDKYPNVLKAMVDDEELGVIGEDEVLGVMEDA